MLVAPSGAGRSFIMLLLNESIMNLNAELIKACVSYVIRDGKRFKRYPLHLGKDIKRIDFLWKRSSANFPLVREELEATFGVSGWKAVSLADFKTVASADFAEVVALMEYWGLWGYFSQIVKLK
jgi:hypothetical protein